MNEIASANPFPQDAVDRLELTDAELDLRAAIMATESVETSAPARKPRTRLFSGLGAIAVVAVAALALVIVSPWSSSNKLGNTAYAAGLVHFAENSPLVLLDLDGWHVVRADESNGKEGGMNFLRGTAPLPPQNYDMTDPDHPKIPPIEQRQRQAELDWYKPPIAPWYTDRAASAKVQSTAPVLGTTARVYQYDGGKPGDQDITALWMYDGRVMEYRSQVPDMAAFKAQLAALKRVDTNTWLDAMPPSVVKASQRPGTVSVMLRGIPLPPGFDASKDIPGESLTKDHYQLGATVTAAVACRWIQRWSDGRKAGDDAKVQEAIKAMATAPDWQILKDMRKEGDWSPVLIAYAKAMPSGKWYGRPLEGDVQEGLGCDTVGVQLKNP